MPMPEKEMIKYRALMEELSGKPYEQAMKEAGERMHERMVTESAELLARDNADFKARMEKLKAEYADVVKKLAL